MQSFEAHGVGPWGEGEQNHYGEDVANKDNTNQRISNNLWFVLDSLSGL